MNKADKYKKSWVKYMELHGSYPYWSLERAKKFPNEPRRAGSKLLKAAHKLKLGVQHPPLS